MEKEANAEDLDKMLDSLGGDEEEEDIQSEEDRDENDEKSEDRDQEGREDDEDGDDSEEEEDDESEEGSAQTLLIKKLSEELDALRAEVAAGRKAQEKQKEEEPLDLSNALLTAEEADNLLDDTGNTVNTVLQRLGNAIYERVKKDINGLQTQIRASKEETDMASYADKFFKENEDIAKYKSFFGYHLQLIAQKYEKSGTPKDLDSMMKEAGRIVRKEMGIKPGGAGKGSKVKDRPKSKPPSSTRPKNARRTSRKEEEGKNSISTQMDEMLAALGKK